MYVVKISISGTFHFQFQEPHFGTRITRIIFSSSQLLSQNIHVCIHVCTLRAPTLFLFFTCTCTVPVQYMYNTVRVQVHVHYLHVCMFNDYPVIL